MDEAERQEMNEMVEQQQQLEIGYDYHRTTEIILQQYREQQQQLGEVRDS